MRWLIATPLGIYPLVPLGVAWNGNNIGGSLKRGVGIAMHVGFGNLGGVIAAFVYQSKHAPRYVLAPVFYLRPWDNALHLPSSP